MIFTALSVYGCILGYALAGDKKQVRKKLTRSQFITEIHKSHPNCEGVCAWRVKRSDRIEDQNMPIEVYQWEFVSSECQGNIDCGCVAPNIMPTERSMHIGDIFYKPCQATSGPSTGLCGGSRCMFEYNPNTQQWINVAAACNNGCQCQEPDIKNIYTPHNGYGHDPIDINKVIDIVGNVIDRPDTNFSVSTWCYQPNIQ